MKQLHLFHPEYSNYSWEIYDLGTIAYEKALQIQEETWLEIKDGANHRIYLLEHPNVITLGKRTEEDHLLLSKKELQEAGIELYRVDRGGSATFHGPGQLVGYIHCKSSRVGGIHELVERILTAIAQTLQSFGIDCEVDRENPGIWTQTEVPRKLAAVGLSNRDGYTKHGFAINVDLPLTGFTAIVPCGLTLPVTTMAIELGKRIEVEEVKQVIVPQLQHVLEMDPEIEIINL